MKKSKKVNQTIHLKIKGAKEFCKKCDEVNKAIKEFCKKLDELKKIKISFGKDNARLHKN